MRRGPPRSPKTIALSALGKCCKAINPILARFYQKPCVVHAQIECNGMPSAIEGFRIAFLVDLHIGPTIPLSYIQDLVDTVNGLQADLIALGGDYVFQD